MARRALGVVVPYGVDAVGCDAEEEHEMKIKTNVKAGNKTPVYNDDGAIVNRKRAGGRRFNK